MATMLSDMLSRDELALIRFYRGLPFEKQFRLLEEAEHDYNDIRRMEFLTERPGEGCPEFVRVPENNV